MCALALHLAFPLTTWWWIAPFACGGLFFAWYDAVPRTAALAGYASGVLFFSLGLAWFGQTAGTLIGPFAPVLYIGPAMIEALAFAFAGLVASLAARRLDARTVPFVAAAAFALGEQVRSTGPLGVPLGQLGTVMADSPLRPLAAFGGGYALTFATALLGASLAWWLLDRTDRRRAGVAAAAWLGIGACAALAWAMWPARHYAPPARRVAAVQGGIAQSLKMSAQGRELGIARYTAMTRALRAEHPTLVLWPETVITLDLTGNDARDRGQAWRLRSTFASIAAELGAVLWVGAWSDTGTSYENALWIFEPRAGGLGATETYAKEQLVPFAEYLPGPAWLRALPGASNIGAFTPGQNAHDTYAGATALICWESLFGDLAHARLRDDPSLLLVASDDAWFGHTAGPYELAQSATLRAVETGRWVLRAGATGISGIVAPDGTWTQRTRLDEVATVVGLVGAPAPPPYARIGPGPVEVVLVLLVALPFLAAAVASRARRA